jgi:hypothetical protein
MICGKEILERMIKRLCKESCKGDNSRKNICVWGINNVFGFCVYSIGEVYYRNDSLFFQCVGFVKFMQCIWQ